MSIRVAKTKISIRIILLFIIFIGAVYSLGVIIHEVHWEKEQEFDARVSRFVTTKVVDSSTTDMMKNLSFLASSDFLLFCYIGIVSYYILHKKQRWLAIAIGAIGLLGHLITLSMKTFFARTRPEASLVEQLTNYSFPSGHSTSAFIFYGLLAWLIARSDVSKPIKYSLIVVLILLAIAIGISRIYLGFHFATDVLAGFCVGIAWLCCTIPAIERLHAR